MIWLTSSETKTCSCIHYQHSFQKKTSNIQCFFQTLSPRIFWRKTWLCSVGNPFYSWCLGTEPLLFTILTLPLSWSSSSERWTLHFRTSTPGYDELWKVTGSASVLTLIRSVHWARILNGQCPVWWVTSWKHTKYPLTVTNDINILWIFKEIFEANLGYLLRDYFQNWANFFASWIKFKMKKLFHTKINSKLSN